MDLALLRLVAQRVVGPSPGDPTAVVRHLLAVQGQDAPGAVRSIALRSAGRSGQAVLDAYDAGSIVRSWPMRGTLHVVLAEDLAWMLALMGSRTRRQAMRVREQNGLTEADLSAAAEVAHRTIPARGLTRAELRAAFADAGLPVDASRTYHLLVGLALDGVLCLGPHDGGEQRFVLLDAWVSAPRDLAGEDALAELALRYALGHGPATDRDLARWSGLPLGAVRSGLAAVADRLASAEVGGAVHWFDPTLPDLLATHRREAEAVHLLPGFDEIVLGYADRTATVPPDVAGRIVPGGNGAFRATVLHRGVVVGTWTRPAGAVQVTTFGPIAPEVGAGVEAAVARLP